MFIRAKFGIVSLAVGEWLWQAQASSGALVGFTDTLNTRAFLRDTRLLIHDQVQCGEFDDATPAKGSNTTKHKELNKKLKAELLEDVFILAKVVTFSLIKKAASVGVPTFLGGLILGFILCIFLDKHGQQFNFHKMHRHPKAVISLLVLTMVLGTSAGALIWHLIKELWKSAKHVETEYPDETIRLFIRQFVQRWTDLGSVSNVILSGAEWEMPIYNPLQTRIIVSRMDGVLDIRGAPALTFNMGDALTLEKLDFGCLHFKARLIPGVPLAGLTGFGGLILSYGMLPAGITLDIHGEILGYAYFVHCLLNVPIQLSMAFMQKPYLSLKKVKQGLLWGLQQRHRPPKPQAVLDWPSCKFSGGLVHRVVFPFVLMTISVFMGSMWLGCICAIYGCRKDTQHHSNTPQLRQQRELHPGSAHPQQMLEMVQRSKTSPQP